MEDHRTLTTQLTGETLLPRSGTLVMLGNADQREKFADAFEKEQLSVRIERGRGSGGR